MPGRPTETAVANVNNASRQRLKDELIDKKLKMQDLWHEAKVFCKIAEHLTSEIEDIKKSPSSVKLDDDHRESRTKNLEEDLRLIQEEATELDNKCNDFLELELQMEVTSDQLEKIDSALQVAKDQSKKLYKMIAKLRNKIYDFEGLLNPLILEDLALRLPTSEATNCRVIPSSMYSPSRWRIKSSCDNSGSNNPMIQGA